MLLLAGLKNLERGTVELYTVPNVQNPSIYGDDFFFSHGLNFSPCKSLLCSSKLDGH